ncbi:unnamed protein product [Ilex paraguariensis]|uniref:Bromo domain-containing protein n=1 Tax=Ilex paraguariensis TaxID=185542 RepID=A0ABC8SBY4_9AQUA
MTVAESIVKKKLKIKICASKKAESEPGTESCEVDQRDFMNDKCGRILSVNVNNNSETNKSQKFIIGSSEDSKVNVVDSLQLKLTMGCSNKRRPPGMVDDQMNKRQKIDRRVKQQCSSILNTLMNHPYAWVFNKPVDPVALNIPDYFSIISQPMDLGTIKTKLEGTVYFSIDEFGADVRLTFSNAMLYNPPSNNVHHMAKELDKIFSGRWKLLETKWNGERKSIEHCISSGRAKNTLDTRQACHKGSPTRVSLIPKSSMSLKKKQTQRKECLEASKGSFLVKAAKLESVKLTEKIRRPFIQKFATKGTDSGRSACNFACAEPPLSSVASKCGSCDGVMCLCDPQNYSSFSDVSSERSMGQDRGDPLKMVKIIIYLIVRIKTCQHYTSANQTQVLMVRMLVMYGAVSALDEEISCSGLHFSTFATSAASGQVIDVQLSPKKALRAAMLKSRFADTILKAKHRTLLDHVILHLFFDVTLACKFTMFLSFLLEGDKADSLKLQQEKEKLKRQQCKEKARIEAQIRAAEAASRLKVEAELKMQRYREREAARVALQKMEKTVEIYENLDILKDLEMLSQCSLSSHCLDGEEDGWSGIVLGAAKGGRSANALERLGLYIKDDHLVYEDYETILKGDGEEGEILS